MSISSVQADEKNAIHSTPQRKQARAMQMRLTLSFKIIKKKKRQEDISHPYQVSVLKHAATPPF